MLWKGENHLIFTFFVFIFRKLVRGYISNSGENYNLFAIPAEKPKTVTKK